MRSYFKKKKKGKKKRTKLQFSTLAKTLSTACNSTFLKFNTAEVLMLQKIEKTERRGGREGENKTDKSSWTEEGGKLKEGMGWRGGVHLHTKIIHKDIGTRNAKN